MKTLLKDMVESILRNVPESRNSDITLMIQIWQRYYPEVIDRGANVFGPGIQLKDLYDLPRHDAIKRIRAMYNAEGKFYPTDWEVARQRGLKEDIWRVEMGYPEKGETVHPTRKDSYMDSERGFAGIDPAKEGSDVTVKSVKYGPYMVQERYTRVWCNCPLFVKHAKCFHVGHYLKAKTNGKLF